MKKHFKLIAFLTLILCLSGCLYLTYKIYRSKLDNNSCRKIDYEEILYNINLATNGFFSDFNNSIVTRYLPININSQMEYVFSNGIELTDEYFFIVKDPSKEILTELESYINTNNNIFINKKIYINSNNGYTYVVYSPSNFSTVSGIIRSFIYC